MAGTRKKILLISYHFPPSNAVGGMRIAHFAKNLPCCGLTPLILTLKNSDLSASGHDWMNGAGEIKITRIGKLPTLLQGYLKLKERPLRLFKKNEGAPKEPDLTKQSTERRPVSETFFKKLKRYFISLFLALPDVERNWVIPA